MTVRVWERPSESVEVSIRVVFHSWVKASIRMPSRNPVMGL